MRPSKRRTIVAATVLILIAVSVVVVNLRSPGRQNGGGMVTVKSALSRGIPETDPTAYWPLEGHAALSGVAGGSALRQVGQVQYATQTGLPASTALPDFTGGGSLSGPLPDGSVTNQWREEFVARFGTGSNTIDDASFTVPVRLTSPNGTVNLWEVLISAGTAILQWSDTSGSYADLLDSGIAVDDGQWHHIRVDVAQSGANISASITVDGTAAGPSTLVGKTLNSSHSSIAINPDRDVAAFVGSVGHLAYWAPYTSATDTYDIAIGHDGETATDRFARICTENSIAFDVAT